MVFYFSIYITFDFGLKLFLSLLKWRMLLLLGFTQEEVALVAGPTVLMPTQQFLSRGGDWLYRIDSYGRKLPHVLHWAGLAQVITLCTSTTWQRFQFSVMGATTAIIIELLTYNTHNFYINMWIWLSVSRTGDGYARRMNDLYCSMSSVTGMGCVVPLCASMLANTYGAGSTVKALLNIITIPCAYGDCLAEIVGVNGCLRFKVYGIGEVNNKSVEGMIAMFLGSVLPSLQFAPAVGGWEYLCIVGVMATIAETWSPRGTDNVFIPLFSAIGVWLACQISGVNAHWDGVTAQ